MSEDMLLHISTGRDQNKLATMLAGYLTREELFQLDIKGLNSYWDKYGRSGFLNSDDAIKNDNVMYKIQFEKSKTSFTISMELKSDVLNPEDINTVDYIAFKIRYRDKFNVLIKISPNPNNPKFICICFGKALNYSQYKCTFDKMYNKDSVSKNFQIMSNILLLTEPDGFESFSDFFYAIKHRAPNIDSIGFNQVIGSFEYIIDTDYLAAFSFSIRDIKTDRMEILYFEDAVVDVYRLLRILNTIYDSFKI